MSEGKSLLLFAGINGAGKTSLYNTIKTRRDLGIRVSIDDNAENLGDWRDPVIQMRASCLAIKQVLAHIKNGVTFNEETTLPGVVVAKQLSEAKKAGYTVILYFVGVDGVETAVERVKKRMIKGGHGISEEVIRKRYLNMPGALSKILPLCDRAFFYDNTEMFRQIAYIENNNFADIDPNLPEWFYYVTGRKPM